MSARTMTSQIVTSICVDEQPDDALSVYPMLGGAKDSNERRAIYWRLVTLFCCTSIRCNPEHQHLVYTNDKNDVFIGNVNIKKFLSDLGVDVVELSFKTFSPPNTLSKRFKNAFYKLEVIQALGMSGQPVDTSSILLDSDCIWANISPQLHSTIQEPKILLYDIYKKDDPFEKHPAHNLSMADIGKVFKSIDPACPEPYPIWYGGEIIGGRSSVMKVIANELENVFNQIIEQSKTHQYLFANGQNIFDGMEHFTSLVYNKKLTEIGDASKFIKRLYTGETLNNVEPEDINLPIWHLPAEKQRGMLLLFKEAVRLNSKFWSVEPKNFSHYLGEYVGIPTRKKDISNDLTSIISNNLDRVGRKLKKLGKF
jgi:hypothetical protein